MEEKRERRKERHRDKKTATFGFLFLLFAALGVIFSIITITRGVGKFVSDNSENKKIERFLTPIVMFDPAPFEDAAKLDKTLLLRSAIWATLLNTDTTQYATNDMGFLIVPATDIEVYAAKVYGKDIKLEHMSTGGAVDQFYYDQELKAYIIPPIGQSSFYTPSVEKVLKNADEYHVTVGYVPPGSMWGMFADGAKEEPKPEKYMLYVLKKEGRGYRLVSISDIKQGSGTDVSTTSSQSSEAISSTVSAQPEQSSSEVSSAVPPEALESQPAPASEQQ